MHAEDPPARHTLIMHAICNEELDKRPGRKCSGPCSNSSTNSMRSLAEGSLHGGKHTHLSIAQPSATLHSGRNICHLSLRPEASSVAL